MVMLAECRGKFFFPTVGDKDVWVSCMHRKREVCVLRVCGDANKSFGCHHHRMPESFRAF